MKRRHLFLILTAATLLVNTASHAIDTTGELGENGGYNNNPHNLSSWSGNSKKADTETQICIFCHTPHGSSPSAPLWGRPDPTNMGSFNTRSGLGIANVGIANVTLYNSASGDYPNGASKLCLSCHDGVTAMGVLLHNTTIDMTNLPAGDYAIAVDLTTSHPISFVYNGTVQAYLGATYKWPATGAYLDGNSRVQCTICHQPHKNTKIFPANSLPFWRDTTTVDTNTAYNNICGDCHTSTYTQVAPDQFPDHNF